MATEAATTTLPEVLPKPVGKPLRPEAKPRLASMIFFPFLVISLTTILSFFIHLKINVTVLPLFVVAVMISAWKWGLSGGVWGTLLAWFCYLFFFIPPILTFYILDLESAARMAELVITSLITLVLTVGLNRSRERFRSEHLHLREVLRQLPSGVLIANSSGQIILANDQVEKIWDRPIQCPMNVAEYVRWAGFHPDGRPYEAAERPLVRALARGESVLGEEIGILRGDGSRATIQVNAAPIRNSEGAVIEGVITFQDVTTRRRAEEGIRFLAQASVLLSSSLDYESTLSNLAKVAVPNLASWCSVYMKKDGPGGPGLRRVAFAALNSADALLLNEIEERYPIDPDASHGPARVIRTAEPEMYSELSDDVLSAVSGSPEHLEVFRRLGIKSWIAVPLGIRGKMEGAIFLATSDPARRYESGDLDLARALAERATLAIENARLYRSTQDALREEGREVERHKALAATFLGITSGL